MPAAWLAAAAERTRRPRASATLRPEPMPPPPATRSGTRRIVLDVRRRSDRPGWPGRVAAALPGGLLTIGMVAVVLTGSRWRPPASSPTASHRPLAAERVVFVAPSAPAGQAAPPPSTSRAAPPRVSAVPAAPALAPPAADTGGAPAPAPSTDVAVPGSRVAPATDAAPQSGPSAAGALARPGGGAPFAPSMRAPRPLDARLHAAWGDMAAQRDRTIRVREDAGRLLAGRDVADLTPDERSALVRSSLADERARAGAAPSGGAASAITRASGPNLLRDGLFGGGPKRAERARDRLVHAETKQRLRDVDERARARADSLARAARSRDSSAAPAATPQS
jgi:hypothetical protein